jgi:GTPase Era involved in 16S rRNA processing
LKARTFKPARAAIAATVANMSLPTEADVHDTPGIPQGEFQRILQSAAQKKLTEAERRQLVIERQRATRKRKNAVIAGHPIEAASASSREQAIAQIFDTYTQSGVRWEELQQKRGKTTGEQAQKRGKETKAQVHRLATELLRSCAARFVSGIICSRLGLTRPTVLKHLRDHTSGHWAKKEKVK